eukprot:323407_1
MNKMLQAVPDIRSELMDIFENQRNKRMNSDNEPIQMLTIDGYIRYNADILDFPQCISKVVSIYYVPMSFRCKITQSFENEVNNIVMNMHAHPNNTIEQNIFEPLHQLAQVFPLLHESYHKLKSDSFYITHWDAVTTIIRGMSDVWNKQYLLDQIGIMEYTTKVETFMQKCQDSERPYSFEKASVDVVIPSYNRCILEKNNGDYNTLVTVLNKSQLKRIYHLFMKMNSGERG